MYSLSVKHLVLIDGHHLMYRAYWAIPRTLTTKTGEQVNTVFGVASMVISILKQEEPDAFLFCFDAGEETFRHQEMGEAYKAGRAETPDDFYVQIPRVHEFLNAMQIPQVSDSKYEADDFLCAYAKAGEAAGMRVTIVTGDRDAFQLASEKTRIAIPHKGYQQAEYLGPAEILAKYGIRPDQVASYKGLTGDSSDNLPGVKGIGPKGAAALLQKYDTLEGVYAHLEEISESTRKKLEADRDQAFFCERMATLRCDFNLPLSLEEISVHPRPGQPVIDFFKSVDFSLLQRRLSEMSQTPYGKRIFEGDIVPATVGKTAPKKEEQPSLF